MVQMQLRYPVVEALLAELHSVPATGRVALMARVKNLQRKGWPPGTNSGRGKPADYGFQATVDLLMAFELADLGIPPEQSVDILRRLDWWLADDLHLHRLGEYLIRLTDEGPSQIRKFAMGGALLAFNLNGLSGMGGGGSDGTQRQDALSWISLSDKDHVWDVFQAGRGFTAVNVTLVLIDAALALEKVGGPDKKQFGEAVLAWLDLPVKKISTSWKS